MTGGILGDTPERSYGDKLSRFNRFAAPEIRAVITSLELNPGDRVLDAGCGVGLTSQWLSEHVGESGSVLGVDLARDHVRAAQDAAPQEQRNLQFIQGDINEPLFSPESFDLIWCSNTINHLGDPVETLKLLRQSLVPGGRFVIAQSALLPEMVFAWDERLEREVTLACRRYYREKYGIDERTITGMRRLLGWMLDAGFSSARPRTVAIERAQPLGDADREYLQHAVFDGYWGHRVRSHLSDADWNELQQLTTPGSPDYALDRHDFHYIQTYTVVIGHKDERGSHQ